MKHRTACLCALAAATLLASACSGSGSFPHFNDDELPWPMEAQGCDKDSAPPRPDRYDERAIATAMMWVYRDHPVESYCGCTFTADGRIHTDRCGYQNADDPEPHVQWQAVVPPPNFGSYRPCWKEHDEQEVEDTSARKHCEEVDDEYRQMETDLYNYLPAVSGLAQKRGDNPFGLVQLEPRAFGECNFEIQSVMGKYSLIEPPDDVRGDIARTYLYMAAHYGKGKDWKIKLLPEQRKMFQKWSDEDPVDDWERMRACRIAAIQGWANPYVK